MKKLFLLITVICFVSCSIFRSPPEIDDDYREDSLSFVKILDKSLALARKNINEEGFYQSINYKSITAQVQFGPLFSSESKHLFIESKGRYSTQFNIFVLKNRSFQSIYFDEIGNFNFLGYAILEINGDSKNDFIVSTMASSGCCPREMNDVNIFNTDTEGFHDAMYFMNPIFQPTNRLIYGSSYGHPLDCYLYKYQWNGFTTDTLEYIMHNLPDTTNRTFLQIRKPESDKPDTLLINTVPDEYNEVSSWFESN